MYTVVFLPIITTKAANKTFEYFQKFRVTDITFWRGKLWITISNLFSNPERQYRIFDSFGMAVSIIFNVERLPLIFNQFQNHSHNNL